MFNNYSVFLPRKRKAFPKLYIHFLRINSMTDKLASLLLEIFCFTDLENTTFSST